MRFDHERKSLRTPFKVPARATASTIGPHRRFRYIHRLGAVTRSGLLQALARLARGRFAGGRKTRSWLARQAEVRNGGDPFLVECDGEVVRASFARFSILAPKVRLCS